MVFASNSLPNLNKTVSTAVEEFLIIVRIYCGDLLENIKVSPIVRHLSRRVSD